MFLVSIAVRIEISTFWFAVFLEFSVADLLIIFQFSLSSLGHHWIGNGIWDTSSESKCSLRSWIPDFCLYVTPRNEFPDNILHTS
jgi:hypothetical protein